MEARPLPAEAPRTSQSKAAVYYNEEPSRAEGGTFNGSLLIVGTGDSITGTYQCFAMLSNAPKTRAMSERVYVRTQVFRPFKDEDLRETTRVVTPGEYISLPCEALPMTPTPLVSWALEEKEKAPLIDNQRIVQVCIVRDRVLCCAKLTWRWLCDNCC